MAEIRDEHQEYEAQQSQSFEEPEPEEPSGQEEEDPRSLAAIFAQEPAPRKKAPAVYRSYMGGRCQNPACGADLGYIETEGGRDRLYCNDACRVAAFRTRQRETKRAEKLQYNAELRAYWKLHNIHGEVLLRLQEILLQHGKKAAKAATDAVLVALAAAQEAGSQEHFRLIDEIMAGGAATDFEELRLTDFRVAAGFEAWSTFVSGATLTTLRQLRGYFYEVRQREYQKAQARKRLKELGH